MVSTKRILNAVACGGFIVIALCLCVSCSGPERVAYRAGTSYLPLLEGRTLQYQEQRAGGAHTYTMMMQFAGGQTTKVYALKFEGADFGEATLLSRDSLVVYSTNDPYTAMEPRGVLPEYRQLWVDASAKVGHSWSDDDTGTKTTFAALESITVPAGSYERCYKTLTEARQELFDSLAARRDRGELSTRDHEEELERARQVITRWFAPGVGLVKEQIGSGITRVLMQIEKEGTGIVDTTMPVRYELEG